MKPATFLQFFLLYKTDIFLHNFSLLGFIGLQPIEKIWKCEPIKEVSKYPEKTRCHYPKDLNQSSSEKATFTTKVHKRQTGNQIPEKETSFSLTGCIGKEPIEKTWKCEPTGGKLKWGTIIPLIGGSSIGCSKSAGNLPAFHLTYTPFKGNEAHLERYWPKVPKYYIDKDQQPENMTGKIFSN